MILNPPHDTRAHALQLQRLTPLLHQYFMNRSPQSTTHECVDRSSASLKLRQIGVSVGTVALITGLMGLSYGQIGYASRVSVSNVDCLVEPSMVVELGAAVPGQLAYVSYDRSDYVEAGTLLGSLESGVEEVALEIATQLASASTAIQLRQLSASFGIRTEKRNQELLASDTISQQSMDQVTTDSRIAQLQVQQEREAQALAKLDLARTQANLDRRFIVAPFSGSITQRYRSPGEFVDNDPVYQLSKLDPLNIEALLPIAELGSVSVGSKVDIRLNVAGFDDKTYEGTVQRIDSVADAASATYGVRVELENPDLTIPSGIRCIADFRG